VASDDHRLLRHLLAAWRETRDPALEPYLDKLRDPEPPWPKSPRDALARVRALAALPPDPRISATVAAAARTYDGVDARELHHAIAALLKRAPSARLLPAIDAIEVARGEMTRAIYAEVRAIIAALAPTPADPALLEAARSRLGDDRDVAALFAQVAASPGDLALRSVLADRLQQAGDPRGDFIALQLAGTGHRRAEALLAQHGDAWTGPLPGVDRATRRFARGFLVAADVVLSPQLARALDRPEWATIEELAITGDAGEAAALVARMPLLRRLAAPLWAIDEIARAGGAPSLQALVALGGHARPAPDAFPALAVLFGELYAPRPREVATLERRAAGAGIRALGHAGVWFDDIRAVIRGRTMEQRFAFGERPDGLALPGWLVRVAADRPVAELGFGAGRRHRDRVRDVVDHLRAAAITELVVHAPTPRVRAALADVPGVSYVDGALDLLA